MNEAPADVQHGPCCMLPHLGHHGEQHIPAVGLSSEPSVVSYSIAWLQMLLLLVHADDHKTTHKQKLIICACHAGHYQPSARD